MSFKGINKVRDAVDYLTEVLGESIRGFESDEEDDRAYSLLLSRTLEIRDMILQSRQQQNRAMRYESAEVPNFELMEEISDVIASIEGQRYLTRPIIKRLLVVIEEEYGRPVEREDILRFYKEGKLEKAAFQSYRLKRDIPHYLMAVGLLPIPRKKGPLLLRIIDAVRREQRKRRCREASTT